jgi:CheY-like chemotaxis protein
MVTQSMSKRRVLLVDDDLLTLTTISQVLRNAGYETVETTNGQDALNMIGQFNPDLAVLDVMMSGMSGIELAKHLHLETSIPFMFISAHAEADIVRQATENGAVGYLLKPFEIAQIIPAFEAALGRADEIRLLRGSEANLTTALNAGRETSMAVGMLMAKFHTDRDTAFEVLRAYSRSSRSKINEVANSLLAAEEMFSSFRDLFAKHPGA